MNTFWKFLKFGWHVTVTSWRKPYINFPETTGYFDKQSLEDCNNLHFFLCQVLGHKLGKTYPPCMGLRVTCPSSGFELICVFSFGQWDVTVSEHKQKLGTSSHHDWEKDEPGITPWSGGKWETQKNSAWQCCPSTPAKADLDQPPDGHPQRSEQAHSVWENPSWPQALSGPHLSGEATEGFWLFVSSLLWLLINSSKCKGIYE